MYNVVSSNRFKKDLKLALKRGYDMELMQYVVDKLADGKALEKKYKDHELKGDYSGFRECHIQPDWLLVYQIIDEDLVLFLSRTGTHSDLF